MVDRDRRGGTVVVTILLGALVPFLGLLAASVVAAVVIVAATDMARSGTFYWGSAIGGVLVLAASGLIAGRIAVSRLRRVDLVGGVLPYAVAAAGPMLVAVVWSAFAAVGPVFGVLAALAAGSGAALGVRLRS